MKEFINSLWGKKAGKAAIGILAALFIIGGGEIFKQTINIADRLELTHVELDVQDDAHYPEIPSEFKKISTEQHIDDKSGIAFAFVTYQK